MAPTPAKWPWRAVRWWAVAVAVATGVSLPLGTPHAAGAGLTPTRHPHATGRYRVAPLSEKSAPSQRGSRCARVIEPPDLLEKRRVNDWRVLRYGQLCFERCLLGVSIRFLDHVWDPGSRKCSPFERRKRWHQPIVQKELYGSVKATQLVASPAQTAARSLALCRSEPVC